jgi:hypothetical protein
LLGRSVWLTGAATSCRRRGLARAPAVSLSYPKSAESPDDRACESVVGAHKCAPPFTEAEFEIRYGTGVDTLAELIDLGLARGLVEKSGNHLSFAGTTLGNGREKSRDALAQSPELQSTLRQAIWASGPVRPGRREAAA